MKISSLGKLALGCAMSLATSTAFANATPNLTDGSGNPVKDGSGACVVTSGIVHPDCAGVKAAPDCCCWRMRLTASVRLTRGLPAGCCC